MPVVAGWVAITGFTLGLPPSSCAHTCLPAAPTAGVRGYLPCRCLRPAEAERDQGAGEHGCWLCAWVRRAGCRPRRAWICSGLHYRIPCTRSCAALVAAGGPAQHCPVLKLYILPPSPRPRSPSMAPTPRPTLLFAPRAVKSSSPTESLSSSHPLQIPFYGSYTETDPAIIAQQGVERFKKEGR